MKKRKPPPRDTSDKARKIAPYPTPEQRERLRRARLMKEPKK